MPIQKKSGNLSYAPRRIYASRKERRGITNIEDGVYASAQGLDGAVEYTNFFSADG